MTKDELSILAWLMHTENTIVHDGDTAIYEGQEKPWRHSCTSYFVFDCDIISLPNKQLADYLESERKRVLHDLAELLERNFREEMKSESAYGHVLVVKHGEWMRQIVELGEADWCGEGPRPGRHIIFDCTYAFFKAENME